NQLVDQGNTVVIIEHNMDVIKTADWIVDLGPEGGNDGGRVVATGTPEEVVQQAQRSYTGQYLQKALGGDGPRLAAPSARRPPAGRRWIGWWRPAWTWPGSTSPTAPTRRTPR